MRMYEITINGNIATRTLTNRKGQQFDVMVSVEDADLLMERCWSYNNTGGVRYVLRTHKDGDERYTQYLHREVAKRQHGSIPDGLVVDHLNANPLDNRRDNLTLTTNVQNNRANSRRNRLGYRGVYSRALKNGVRYYARWSERHQHRYSRTNFHTPEEAARAYDNGVIELAKRNNESVLIRTLNFPESAFPNF